jgi:hypothetical protein
MILISHRGNLNGKKEERENSISYIMEALSMGFDVEMKKYAIHYFWHENDEFTLTSKNYIWAYPTKENKPGTISVLPEINNQNVDGCKGVCSDFIKNYK